MKKNCASSWLFTNIIQPGRSQIKIWRMRIACWIPKTTNTPTRYVILIACHYNNDCTNAPLCYVIRTLPVLFFPIHTYLQVHHIRPSCNCMQLSVHADKQHCGHIKINIYHLTRNSDGLSSEDVRIDPSAGKTTC